MEFIRRNFFLFLLLLILRFINSIDYRVRASVMAIVRLFSFFFVVDEKDSL